MPSTFKSPFATGFKSAVNRGVSYNQAVENLARRSGVTENKVWESLYKAGCCNRQKFNGQWIYFPNFNAKWTATTARSTQFNTWQCFIEWCLTNGICTPTTLSKKCGSQNAFMNACKTWWNRQFTGSAVTVTKAKAKSKKSGTKTGAKRTSTKKSAAKTGVKASARKSGKPTAKKNVRTTAKKSTASSGSYRFPVARKSSARKAA